MMALYEVEGRCCSIVKANSARIKCKSLRRVQIINLNHELKLSLYGKGVEIKYARND